MSNLSGRKLGAYEIIEVIGKGGMATVYRAHHPLTARDVAVKVLRSDIADDDTFSKRFEREAKTVAGLQHIHILPVFDFGEQEGVAYLVMPMLSGRTLADVINSQTLSLKDVARIFRQLAGALDYAHARGILHRDIKPENIMIDDSQNALLADFGLTRMVDAAGISRLTSDETVIGTPAYMSPEQGQGMDLDERSDLYSLGVVLYEMLTGRVPFQADTPVGVIFKHISDPIVPVNSERPDLPDEINEVLETALAKEPANRYASATAMADALDAAIAGSESWNIYKTSAAMPKPRFVDGEFNTTQVQMMNAQNAQPSSSYDDEPVMMRKPKKGKPANTLTTSMAFLAATVLVLVVGALAALLIVRTDAPVETVSADVKPVLDATDLAATVDAQVAARLTAEALERPRLQTATPIALSTQLPTAVPPQTNDITMREDDVNHRKFDLYIYPDVVWSPDGQRLLSSTLQGEMLIIALDQGRADIEQQYRIFGSPLGMDWSHDGRYAAVGDDNGNIVVVDTEAATVAYELEQISPNRDLSFSPDGRYLASMSLADLRIWDMETGEQVSEYDASTGLAVAWSPDGTHLAIGERHQWQIFGWDVTTQTLDPQLTVEVETEKGMHHVAWSPDGDYLLTAAGDRSLAIWQTNDGQQVRVYTGIRGDLSDVAWSPDGAYIAASSEDEMMRIWDVASGDIVQSLEVDLTPRGLDWSPDGTEIAVSAITLNVWRVVSDAE